MNAETNAQEIVKMLRAAPNYNAGVGTATIEDEAADLIESLTADAASCRQVKKCLADEGFSDLPTMIARYKQVMRDVNDIEMAKDEKIETILAENKKLYDLMRSGEQRGVEKATEESRETIADLTAQVKRLEMCNTPIAIELLRCFNEYDSKIYGFTAQLTASQRRADALLADLKEACATTCGFCKFSEYNPIRGSYPGKSCPGNHNDCNGECRNFDWRGPSAEGEKVQNG
jgi:hypothetical protein